MKALNKASQAQHARDPKYYQQLRNVRRPATCTVAVPIGTAGSCQGKGGWCAMRDTERAYGVSYLY
eukprot:350796-Rhodomonas_salina.1